jgi:hypothetical protein
LHGTHHQLENCLQPFFLYLYASLDRPIYQFNQNFAIVSLGCLNHLEKQDVSIALSFCARAHFITTAETAFSHSLFTPLKRHHST